MLSISGNTENSVITPVTNIISKPTASLTATFTKMIYSVLVGGDNDNQKIFFFFREIVEIYYLVNKHMLAGIEFLSFATLWNSASLLDSNNNSI